MIRHALQALGGGIALAATLALAGCAGGGGGDPGPTSMPAGYTCQSVRAELGKLDARGVRSRIDASTSGKKLPPAQQAEVDRYNQLLGYYLGGRCHV